MPPEGGMSAPVAAAVLWVVLATCTAFLPMRRQFGPGIALLLAAPALIIWLGLSHGLLAGLGALAAVLSMFRKPLAYYARRWSGRAGDVSE